MTSMLQPTIATTTDTTTTKRARDPDTGSKSIPITYIMISDDSESDSEEVAPNSKVVDAKLAFKTFKDLIHSVHAIMTNGRTTGSDDPNHVDYDISHAKMLLRESRKYPKSSIEDFDEENVEEISKCLDYINDLTAKISLMDKTGREAGFSSVSGEETVDEKRRTLKPLYEITQSVDSVSTVCIFEDEHEVQYNFSHFQRMLETYQGWSADDSDEEESHSSMEEKVDKEKEKEFFQEQAKKITKFLDSLPDVTAKFTLIVKAGREAGFCSVESEGDESFSAKKRARM
jgi:hypothetical protein